MSNQATDNAMPIHSAQGYVFQARLALDGGQAVGDAFTKIKVAGVLVAHQGQPLIVDTDDWDGIQCEVIIRPIKRLGTSKIKGMRMDMAAQQLAKDDAWVK